MLIVILAFLHPKSYIPTTLKLPYLKKYCKYRISFRVNWKLFEKEIVSLLLTTSLSINLSIYITRRINGKYSEVGSSLYTSGISTAD